MNWSISWTLSLLIPIGLIYSCKTISNNSKVKVDAAGSAFFDAEISDGILVVKHDDSDRVVQAKITAQLSYTLSQLEYFHSSSDSGRNSVKILSREAVGISDPASDIVHYQTTLVLAWPKENEHPKALRFALPVSVNEADPNEIYTYYSEDFYSAFKMKCLDAVDSERPAYKFWDYLRPRREGCPLVGIVNGDALQSGVLVEPESKQKIVAVTALLKPSGSVSSNKKPEYDQIWRDGKLVVVGIFTPDLLILESDPGVKGLQNVITNLIENLGIMDEQLKKKKPKSANFNPDESWATLRKRGYYQMTFDSPRGEVVTHFILVESIRDSSAADTKALLTKIGGDVDIYAYFGHASLGKNIRTFINLPSYQANQYSIFMLSACNSFMYPDLALVELNKRLNPGTSSYKYFDVIASSFLAPFGTEFQDLYALMSGVIEGKRTYREILEGYGRRQRAVVFGEEDNGEPFPSLKKE